LEKAACLSWRVAVSRALQVDKIAVLDGWVGTLAHAGRTGLQAVVAQRALARGAGFSLNPISVRARRDAVAQPLQTSCDEDVSNSVRTMAFVGHTSAHDACWQCLQTSDIISQAWPLPDVVEAVSGRRSR